MTDLKPEPENIIQVGFISLEDRQVVFEAASLLMSIFDEVEITIDKKGTKYTCKTKQQ